ncbi:acyltransferase family protein [Actinoplanes sp. NPDC051633]|uniref:acyltransferase family protein n=1 Tax=Actinoplanes sp. NPDC051633 TaxID=3155670 RepID=UPI0034314051
MTDTRVIPKPTRRRVDGAGRSLPTGRRDGHRRDIEGLRAIAVLLVVLYHAGVPLLGGGYVGVDVFFVISGYLITGLLLREVAGGGTISVVGFYARRVLRLLPAAAVVTAVTVLAAVRWLPPLRAPEVALDALFASLYSGNYRLAAAGADYLNAETAASPLQHFWSLAVEEQFYLVWPVLLLVFRRRPAPVLSLLVAASLAVSVWQTDANPTWAYFGLHTRAWELGVGALVAVLALRLPARFASVLCGAGLLAIGLAAVVFTAKTQFPGYASALPVAGAAAVLAGGATAPSGLLGEPVLQAIGRLSYSWYLWHWPFLTIGPVALGIEPGLAVNLALAVAALVAAASTYALVENPLRRLPALRARPRAAVAFGLSITVLTAAGYLAVSRLDLVAATSYRAPAVGAITPAALESGVRTPEVPVNLAPPLTAASRDIPRLYGDGCAADLPDTTIAQPCAYGDVASRDTVVLFGDSHAAQWFPALEQIAQQRRWRLVVVSKNACTAGSFRIHHVTLKRPYNECTAWRERALAHIAGLNPSRIFFASAVASENRVVDDSGALINDPTYANRVRINGWATTVNALRGTGARLYFLEDTPYQALMPVDCLSTHLKNPAACANQREKSLQSASRRVAIARLLRAKGVRTIDPMPWFCTARICPVIVGNVLVFRDRGHMTVTWSRLLTPNLAATLD